MGGGCVVGVWVRLFFGLHLLGLSHSIWALRPFRSFGLRPNYFNYFIWDLRPFRYWACSLECLLSWCLANLGIHKSQIEHFVASLFSPVNLCNIFED